MAMPPEDLTPDQLWVKMQEIPRPTEVVDFPRKDPTTGRTLSRIRIQVLTVDEHTTARLEGRRKVMEKYNVKSSELDDFVMQSVVSDVCAKEALKLACLGVNPFSEADNIKRYPYMFPTDERINTLSADEIVTLFNTYTLVQAKYGPFSESVMSDEEYNAWINVLTEGAKVHFLARKNLPQLAELACGLASRAYLLSLIVESLLKDSQSITASQVERLGIGTSWFTGLQLISSAGDLTLSARNLSQIGEGAQDLDEVIDDWLYKPAPGEPVTLEQAIEIAKRLNE